MSYNTILVCGGRYHDNPQLVYRTLSMLRPNKIVTGGANGVDMFAEAWADKLGVEKEVYPANWAKWGNAAGPIRNKYMLLKENPDLVLAFEGGRGTANMIETAEKYGYEVKIIGGDDERATD
jgi:hypothetical protein